MAWAGSSSWISCQRAPTSVASSRSVADGLAVPGTGRVAGDHVDDVQVRLEPGRHPGRPPDQGVGARRGGDGDHDALAGLPDRAGLVRREVLEELFVGLVGQEPQRQLAQRDQVVGAEEVGEGLGDLGLRVDVAVQHPPAQLLGRGVDQLDLVGLAHHPVRHPLADPGPGHVLDRVGDALQVLDVDGGDHVDAGGEDLQDVLPALVVPTGSRDVGVGQLVDQGHLRVAGAARRRDPSPRSGCPGSRPPGAGRPPGRRSAPR